LKLKIDENLPADCAVILRDAGTKPTPYLMSALQERTTR
jgi:hypothetical protein